MLGANAFAQSPTKHFRILSFSINGDKVSDFDVFLLLNGKWIKPDRDGDTIRVPLAVQEASVESSGIRFVSSNLEFAYDNLWFSGYDDSDEVKSNYRVEVSTDPALIKRRLEEMSDKSKRGLRIKNTETFAQCSP